MAPSDIELSILIVNYNGANLLSPCVDSIFNTVKNTRFEVIIVDNASTDDSREILQTISHPLIVILSDINVGFAAGNNIAAKHARGAFYFALNNDTIVLPGAIDQLVATMKQAPEIGILGPQLLNIDRTIQGQGSILGHFQYRTPSSRTVSFLSGAAMMIPAALYNQIGGFDENYFFYNEDIDLCKTVLNMGYKLVYDPAASIIHIGGQATSTRRRGSIVEGYRGGLYLVRKHYGFWLYQLYRMVMLIGIGVLWIAAAVWPRRDIKRLAYGDVFRIVLLGQLQLERRDNK